MAVVETDIPLWLLYVVAAEQARARGGTIPAAGGGTLTIDASSPASVYQDATSTTTTASFSPPAQSLLVVWARYNTGSGNQPTDPTITDNLGVHLTYTLRAHARNPEVSTSLNGAVAVWTAPINTAPGPMTVSVTETDAATGLAVLAQVWTHGDGQPTSGAVAEGGDNASGTTSVQAYTATADNSRGVMGWEDWNATGVATAGTGCTTTGGDAVDQGATLAYACVLRTTADGVTGVSTTLTINHPSTSQRRWVALEIVPPTGATTVDADAEQASHAVVAENITATLGTNADTTTTHAHTTGDITATATTTTTAGAHTHQAETPTTATAITATAGAHTHDTEDAVFGLSVPAETTTHAHTTGNVTATHTTTTTTATHTHQTEAASPGVAANTDTTPTTHQAFDATVSTAVLTNVNAEQTTHTVATADVTPSIAAHPGTTTHTQTTHDALTALGATSGHPQQAHTAGDVTATTTTTTTAAANAHTTADVTATATTTDSTAPALTHQAFDATVSTLAILNANAETTTHAHTTHDPTATATTNAGHATTTHQAFDATAHVASTVNVNAETTSTTHQTFAPSWGLTPPAQTAPHTHQTHDVTPLLAATTTQAASVTLEAYDATVSTALAPMAEWAVDTGLTPAHHPDGHTTGTTTHGQTTLASSWDRNTTAGSTTDTRTTAHAGVE